MLVPDVNVVFALVYAEHEHSSVANAWLDGRTSTEPLSVCRVVQMGLLRLLTQRAAMGTDVLPAEAAWRAWDDLLQEGRFVFVEEPSGLEAGWRRLCASLPESANVNTDTYLAAFAQASGVTFVTFDKGSARFPDLRLEFLIA